MDWPACSMAESLFAGRSSLQGSSFNLVLVFAWQPWGGSSLEFGPAVWRQRCVGAKNTSRSSRQGGVADQVVEAWGGTTEPEVRRLDKEGLAGQGSRNNLFCRASASTRPAMPEQQIIGYQANKT